MKIAAMKYLFSLFLMSMLTLSSCALSKDGSQARSTPKPSEKVDLGYTEVDADQSAGATSTEKVDQQKYGPNVTLVDILQRTPGVYIQGNGAGARAFIRGVSSINGSNEPLFVVDNVAIGSSLNQLSFLNPQDIDKVTVLKDSSTTTLYGARGVNGVILIRTKKG
jgi:TonB-dependent SusC/RagA subfamily outer membrane receptor